MSTRLRSHSGARTTSPLSEERLNLGSPNLVNMMNMRKPGTGFILGDRNGIRPVKNWVLVC